MHLGLVPFGKRDLLLPNVAPPTRMALTSMANTSQFHLEKDGSMPRLVPLTALVAAGWLGLVALSATWSADSVIEKVPAGLKPVPVPTDNPQTDAKVELGKQLYFDPRL